MAKRFKEVAESQKPVYATIMGAQGTQDTQSAQDTKDTKKQEYYRFNLKMPYEYKGYLQQAAFKASTPTNLVTVTEYICNLIRADMEKNGENL